MHTIKTLRTLCATLALCMLPTLALAQDKPDTKPTRRWALLLSAEDGGQGRSRLRYAQADADSVGRVLTQLGGVATADARSLHNPTPADITKAIGALRAELMAARAEGRPTQIIFYYSGHSDEQGLLLGAKTLGYKALRAEIEALPADVRVVILDSCASGALTRAKGGQVVQGFMQDASTQVQGQAILTSSSASEAAQESDRIGASFFTHALLTGLRGGADNSGDGRVTLNEAYQFAFNETLARTERTQGGAQHPGYELQLAGQGDLVLTDLSQATSALVLDRALTGHLYIRDAQGHLVVELHKNAGRALELALPADTYTLRLVDGQRAQETTIALKRGQRLAPSAWHAAKLDGALASKGGASDPQRPLIAGVDLLPYIGTSSLAPERPRHVSLNIIGGISGGTRGLEIGALNIDMGDMFGVQIGAANLIEGDVMGVQIGALNLGSGRVDALQIGAVNIAGDSSAGVNIAAVSGVHGDFYGVQTAAAAYALGDVTGAQIAAASLAQGEMMGLQISAVNVVGEQMIGAQIGAVNLVSERLRGLQLGAVNLANGEGGVQVGAINISRDADYALGAINIVTDGRTRAVTWLDDSGALRAGVRHGGRHFYQVYFGGMRSAVSDKDAVDLNFGMGLGGITQVRERWSIQGELLTQWFMTERSTWNNPTQIHQARLLAGWEVLPWLSVVAGPTFNVFISESGDSASDFAPLGSWRMTDEKNNLDVSIWPGFSVGVELL
jgi:hypothetical protein